ncbi:MAG: efflux transporter outer membrane subunit [Alphaproteobacteria bacterium]
MPSPIKSMAALASGALLAGCAVGPNFKQPLAPTVTSYTMQGDDTLAATPASTPETQVWWRAFNAPVLDDVMKQAIAGNQNLAEAEATLRAARASESAARGGAFPQVDLNAGAHREQVNLSAFGFTGFPGITLENPLINLYSVGTSVSYDLDVFGGRKRQIEGADARRAAAAARTDAAYLTLTGRVAQTVFDIASLRGEIDAVNAIVEDDRRNLDMVHKAEDAGGAAPSAGLGANAQLAEDLGELPDLKQKLAVARHQLAVLLGKTPAEWTAPDFDLAAFAGAPVSPVSVPSELVRRRPDILAAEAELHAATADVGVATAALYPNISLTASITQSALGDTTDLFRRDASGWSIGGGLLAPVFHGGTLRADKHRAEAQADAALARYRQAVLNAFMQVADQLAALAHDDEELAARQAALDSADANLRSNRGGFEKGGVSLLNVLDAQRQRSRAARLLAESQGRRLRDLGLLAVASAAPWRAD